MFVTSKLASHDLEVGERQPPVAKGQGESLLIRNTPAESSGLPLTRDVSTITELCSQADPDEVEILTLVREQIPRYRLRADSIVSFTGYGNADFSFLNVPEIDEEKVARLTNQQIGETLKYFVLCSERVKQMTKTYNDVEAVTRLLEEKERDLELAARFGQILLEKNESLQVRTEALEDHVNTITETVNQLRHDIGIKDELLRVFNEDLERHDDFSPSTPGEHGLVNMDFLQKKVQTLEDENLNLRLESTKLKSDTENYEAKEKQLVEDCIQQLADVNTQLETFSNELKSKTEENSHQKEEITKNLTYIADLTSKVRKLTVENLDLHEKFTSASESHRSLTKELGSMQDKYDELFEMLEEAQEELRVMRGKHKIRASGNHYHSSQSIPTDSLASELEASLNKELSQTTRRAQSWRVFETAKAARKAALKASTAGRTSMSEVSTVHDTSDTTSFGGKSPAVLSDVESFSDGYSADMDSLYGSNPELGRPGIPGSNDLESALRRLAMKRASDDRDEDDDRRLVATGQRSGYASPYVPGTPGQITFRSGVSTPGSSTTSSYLGGYKMSDKLQIVKPIEGSLTLHRWQHLATPNLGGIFEEREGVQMRGERKLDLVEEIYSLSDFEEDEDPLEAHSRRERQMNSTLNFDEANVRAGVQAGRLLDPRSPTSLSSNNLANLSMSSDSGIMTPGQAAGQTGGQGISLGLASLLNRDNPTLTRAITRIASNPRRTTTTSTNDGGSSSNHDNLGLVISSTPSSPAMTQLHISQSTSRLDATHPKNLPGSRSLVDLSQAMNPNSGLFANPQSQTSSVDKDDSNSPKLFSAEMTGQGFLQSLKNRLWGGGDSAAATDVSTTTSSSQVDTTSKPNAESVFANGAGSNVGVLGALANFRRNGML